jgi:phosphodiesterase/alkaline phosphatase D-like protein/DNA-binding beta-propeller fold protein YncE
MVSCASAVADTGHEYVTRLGEAPPGTPVSEPTAIAIDQATGESFVADEGTGMVDVFGASGAYVGQFGEGLEASGVAVDEASGDVYVSAQSVVDVFKPNSSGGYELLSEWTGANTPDALFGEVAGVAVDNSTSASDPHAGDVYVVDASNGVVDAFKPKPAGLEEAQEGAFVATLSGGRLEEPNGVAVDSATGGVYVADSVKGVVDVFGSSGVFERKLTGAGSPNGTFLGSEEEEGNATAVGVEEASGDVYVVEGERHVVVQFNTGGEWVGWITATPSGPFEEPDGVALAAGGDVYVTDDGTHAVNVFGPGVLVAHAATSKTSKVGKTSAVLSGVVGGEGKAAKYYFEWGTSEAYGSATATETAGSGEEAVQAQLGGLQPGTNYHYRLVVENENGGNVGVDREFTTLPAVEALSTGPAQAITPTGATLTGSLRPADVDTHYDFEWGTTSSFGSTTPVVDAGAGKAPVAAESALSGLRPNTTYDYRLVGSDAYGITDGLEESFTTAGPPRIMTELPTGITHEAATIRAKVNPDELETRYHFEYGETIAYGNEVPVGGAMLLAGHSSVAVSASLSGLKIGATYHYRVVASNSAGSTTGPDHTFTTVPPALITGASTTAVTSSEATLQAEINPLGHETTYYFQYGTAACKPDPEACQSAPVAPGQDIGSGEALIPESVTLHDLVPATTYHYRVIAINSLGVGEGPEQTLTTQASEMRFALADDRAWELVTPPNKHGAPVEALTSEGGLILASEDGDALAYLANGPVTEEPEGNRSPEMQQIIATRGAGGWVSEDVATPNVKAEGTSAANPPEYQFFRQDLAYALVEPWGTTPFSQPPLAPEAKQRTMYIRDNTTKSYVPLVSEANVPAGTQFGNRIHFLAATADLSDVVLRSEVPLTAAPSGQGLYEWSGGGLRFVSLLPSGVPASEAELGFDDHVLAHAISSDGSRVVWTSKDENSGRGHLYMTDTATGQTLQLDAAQGPIEPETGSAQFQTASSDGSAVFFTDKQQLTEGSSAEPAQDKSDLYECEIVEHEGRLSCELKDLTTPQSEGEAAAVQGFLFGASENAEDVYLIAQGVLASNANGDGEIAETGADNLYALHDSNGPWQTTYIATLSSEDSHEWEGNHQADTAFVTARVSPNGRYLAFMSSASLTGYDNQDTNPEAKGAHDEEVYLYDSLTTALTCVSCNPTGARPVGVFDTMHAGEGDGLVVDRRAVWTGHWLAGSVPGWTAQSLTSALLQSRYLSDEGRLFFNSADALVPQVATATRGEEVEGKGLQVGVENVYEYEPSGVGSCESPSGGCVSLISGGTSDRESAFLEASPNGNDVFLLTAAQLLAQDTDTAFDIYDARVCTTESPCLTSPAPPPSGCDSADACRPAEAAQQAPVAPTGTASFAGPGNVSASKTAVLGTKTSRPRSKPPTTMQKLTRAFAACKKRYPRAKKKREACEVQARRRYRPAPKSKKSSERSSRRRARR